jgi:hypothetical protein
MCEFLVCSLPFPAFPCLFLASSVVHEKLMESSRLYRLGASRSSLYSRLHAGFEGHQSSVFLHFEERMVREGKATKLGPRSRTQTNRTDIKTKPPSQADKQQMVPLLRDPHVQVAIVEA